MDKNKGNVTIFVIIIISFISWAVFTCSFLLSGEISVMKDRKNYSAGINEEKLLEAVFHKKIKEIENEIMEKDIKDIIWYFMEKNGSFMWTKNYNSFPISDRGYRIKEIKIRHLERAFSENDKSFPFADYILTTLNSIGQERVYVRISFEKIWENFYIEDIELNKKNYNLKINGQILIEYPKRKDNDINIMKSCELDGIEFEFY